MIKSFIKLIPLVENGSMVQTTGLENPGSSNCSALVCATPALGAQAGQELLPQKKLGHPDPPPMGELNSSSCLFRVITHDG